MPMSVTMYQWKPHMYPCTNVPMHPCTHVPCTYYYYYYYYYYY